MSEDVTLEARQYMDRIVVVSPRHEFIRPWIRAYFANGNTTPLAIVPGPPGDWRDGDLEYCRDAAEFSGGLLFDCSDAWSKSVRLAARAVRNNVGWYSKKSILHAVATRLKPKTWAWIDDDAEVTGNLDECFEAAEHAPGFIYSQFYRPSSIDDRHPEMMFRSRIDPADKICWNSMVFFHGEANDRISEELYKDFPVEDDEIVFGYLYKNNPIWHEGFCDFSIRAWQKNCKLVRDIPSHWDGKLLHYTSIMNGGEIKKMWAGKADVLPRAPFESMPGSRPRCVANVDDDAVDAVFVVGDGSIDGNEELRYALRSMARNCKFVRDVYICGFCPPWVDKTRVKHLQWPDRFSHAKDANIIDKLRHACECRGIAKKILFCSDDQFQTRECSWDDFEPRYLRVYTSDDGWYEARKRIWHTRLRKTLEREVKRRKGAGLDTKDVFYYQPHIWMPIDRDLFIDYAKWCGYERRDDTIIASGYYNFAGVKGRPDFDHCFIGGDAKVNAVIKSTHVAYHDGSYKTAMSIMRKLFPTKCRFELWCAPEAPPDSSGDDGHMESDDPSPASAKEMQDISSVMSKAMDCPVWSSLLGEMSRAEEMRLFGVRGWRTVWRDIMARFNRSTHGGSDKVPVYEPRSASANAVAQAYMSDPESMRTVRFGPVFNAAGTHGRVSTSGRRAEPASSIERISLRDRVKSVLRRRS